MQHAMLLLALIALPTFVYGDDDEGEHGFGFGLFASKPGVAPVNNDMYRKNCAECHFAYQPGLLPKRSWEKMMEAKALANHFGDNAELAENERAEISSYLVHNAADNSDYKRSVKMMGSIRDDETPLRISEVKYFKKKHHEIPMRMVTENVKVKSWSNCAACHMSAEKGSYDEDGVRIPGFGRWED